MAAKSNITQNDLIGVFFKAFLATAFSGSICSIFIYNRYASFLRSHAINASHFRSIALTFVASICKHLSQSSMASLYIFCFKTSQQTDEREKKTNIKKKTAMKRCQFLATLTSDSTIIVYSGRWCI